MTLRLRLFVIGILGVALSACLLTNVGHAQQAFTWTNGDASGSWNDNANWNPNSAYPGSGVSLSDTAAFPVPLSGTVTISSPVTVGAITFSNTVGTVPITIAGTTLNLIDGGTILLNKINNGAYSDTISAPLNLLGAGTLESNNGSFSGNQSVGELLVSGPISGTGALTMMTTATGMVRLTGVNVGFTGTMNIVGPAVTVPTNTFAGIFGSAANFGAATAINFTNATWQSPGNVSGAIPIFINAGGTLFTAYGGYTQNSNMTVNSGGTLQLDSGGGNGCTYSDVLAGPGGLFFSGSKVLGVSIDANLTGATANTLSGPIIVKTGRVELNKPAGVDAIGAGAGLTVGFAVATGTNDAAVLWNANDQINDATVVTVLSLGTGTTNCGQLWLQGHTDTIGGLQTSGSNATAIVSNQKSATGGVLTIAPSAGASYTYNGQILDGTVSGQGTLGIGVAGPGQQIFNGTNTFSGATTVTGGMLTLGASGSLAHATITVSGGTMNGAGTINFNPGEEILVGAAGTFDASGGMQWNLASLSAPSVNLLDFTSGGQFLSPATLESLLNPTSQLRYSLSDVSNVIVATALTTNTWNVDASGNWVGTPSNWVGSVVPNSAGTPANFGSKITAPRTVTVDSPVTVGSINFTNANQYTLSGSGANSITLNNSGVDATIGVNLGSHLIAAPVVLGGNGILDVSVNTSSGTLTISGNVSEASPGAGVLNTAAASMGTVLLTGTNTFTGGATVNGGTLVVGGGSALASTIGVAVKNSGVLGLSASSDNQTIGSLNVESASAGVQINGGTLTVAANGNNNIQGLTGPGTVILGVASLATTQTFGNNSGFTGNLTVNGGNMVVQSSNAFGASGGTTTFQNVTWHSDPPSQGFPAGNVQSFHITGATTQVETGGTNVFTGNLSIDAGATFFYNTGGGNQGTMTGMISGAGNFIDLGGPGGGGFEFSPLTLAGSVSNTLSGNFFLNQGDLTLQMTNGAIAIAGPLTVGAGSNTAHLILGGNEEIDPSVVITFANNKSHFFLNSWNETVGGLTSNAGNGVVSNESSVANSILTIAGSGNYSFGGSLIDSATGASGNLSLVMSGSGTQVLGGSNTYSGGTTINGGGLLTINGSLGHANINITAGTLNGSGKITFNPGEEIVGGAASAFDSSAGMKWDVSALTGSPVPLVDYTSGGTYIAPAVLDSLLTRDSQFLYTLSNTGSVVSAVSKPQNTWAVDSDGAWSDPTNWSSGVAPNAAGAVVNFLDVISAPRTVTVDEPVTLGLMKFNNTNQYTLLASAASNSITLNNGLFNSVIESQQGSHLINAPVVIGGNGVLELAPLSSSGTLTIAGNISEGTAGTGVLTVDPDSTGTVVLTGSDTFTGGVTVHGGTLLASNLASTIAVSVDGGAGFGVSGPSADLTIGSLNSTASNAVIPVNGGTLNVAANGNNSVYGLTGAGVVILTASGSGVTQNLGNNGAFTGSLTIVNGNIATPLGATGAFTANGGTTTLNSVTWGTVASTSENFRITGGTTDFVSPSGTPVLSGGIAINNGATLTYNSGVGGSFSGVISGGGTLIDEGTALTLSGGTAANTLSGTTIVQEGTLTLHKSASVNAIAGPLTIGSPSNVAAVVLGANEQIKPSVVVSFANNTSSLRLQSFNETVGGLTSNSGNGEVGNFGATGSTLTIATVGNNTYGGALDDGFGGSSLALVVGGTGSQSITGPITFSGALEVNSGKLILSGSNTYAGNTIVQGGQLTVVNSYSLPDGGGLIVGSGAGSLAPVIGGQAAASSVAAVPEPGTLALAAAGLMAGAVALRRRKAPRVS